MSGTTDMDILNQLADQLRSPTAPLDRRIEAFSELEHRLAAIRVPATATSDTVEDEREVARASRLAEISRLGALPELSALQPRLDAPRLQQLYAFCDQPMSIPLDDEITRALDEATDTARKAAARLEKTRAEVERDHCYRALLKDMLDLMALLVDGDPEPATHDAN